MTTVVIEREKPWHHVRNAELRGLGLAEHRLVRDSLHFDYNLNTVSLNTHLL